MKPQPSRKVRTPKPQAASRTLLLWMYWPLVLAVPGYLLIALLLGAFDSPDLYGVLGADLGFAVMLGALLASFIAAVIVWIKERHNRKLHFWFASLELVIALVVGYISYAQPSIFFYHEEERCTIFGCYE